MFSLTRKERTEESIKTCKQCKRTRSIHMFYKKLLCGTRRDICMDCFDDKNNITTRRRFLMTVQRKVAEAKYTANAVEIFRLLEANQSLVDYIKASKISKESVIKLLLGLETKGAVRIINTIANGGSYTVSLMKDGVGTSFELELPPNIEILEEAYSKLTAPKVPGLTNKSFRKIGEMVEAGFTKDQIITFGRFDTKTVEKYFSNK